MMEESKSPQQIIESYPEISGMHFLSPTCENMDSEVVNSMFGRLKEHLDIEPKLFPVPLETLIQSWRDGLASVIIDPHTHEIKAYARLTPLVDAIVKEQVGLGSDCPDVYELGTLYVAKDRRGDTAETAEAVVINLYDQFYNSERGTDIIIATVTNIKPAKLIGKSKLFGVNAYITNHRLSFLGSTTCVCERYQQLGGDGMQHGLDACRIRTISQRRIDIDKIPRSMINQDGDLENGRCFMIVTASEESQNRFEAAVYSTFDQNQNNFVATLQSLVAGLKEIGYYGNALQTVSHVN